MRCVSCRWTEVKTVTFNGRVVRRGTVCELDAYCWLLRKPWEDLEPPMRQPKAAAPASMQELIGMDQTGC